MFSKVKMRKASVTSTGAHDTRTPRQVFYDVYSMMYKKAILRYKLSDNGRLGPSPRKIKGVSSRQWKGR